MIVAKILFCMSVLYIALSEVAQECPQKCVQHFFQICNFQLHVALESCRKFEHALVSMSRKLLKENVGKS